MPRYPPTMPYDEKRYLWRRLGKRKARALTEDERKAHSPLRRREHNRNQRALYGERVTSTPYHAEHHPADMVNWFRARYDELEEPVRVVTKQGELKFVQPPCRPPSFAGYCVENQLSQRTLSDWRVKYPEFAEAWSVCEAIQEEALVQLGANGAHAANFATLMMKNGAGLTEKGEITDTAGVTLIFDEQDKEA